MKIIKRGDETPWWVGKQAECFSCHAVVEFESTDVLEEQTREPRLLIGLIAPTLFVAAPCPVCGTTIELTWGAAQEQIDATRAEVV